MCRTLAAWQEVSRVGMFLEICLPCKGIVLEGFGCRIYSCVLRPSVISLVSDAESLLHCLCINLHASIDLCSVSVTLITCLACHKSLFWAVIRSLRSWRKTNSEASAAHKMQDSINSQLPAQMVYLVYNISFLFPANQGSVSCGFQTVVRDF